MDDQKSLIAKRAPLRAGVSKLLDTVENFLCDEVPEDQAEDKLCIFEARLGRLRDELSELDNQVLTAIDPDADPEAYDAEYNRIEDYRITMDTIDIKLRKFDRILRDTASGKSATSFTENDAGHASSSSARPQSPRPRSSDNHSSSPVSDPPASSSTSSDASLVALLEKLVQIQANSANSSVILPSLQIKKFNGDVTHFVTFWDEFKAAVHDRPGLTDIQRFKYLKDLVTGDAAHTIGDIPLTEDNYRDTVKYLFQRFGNVETIVISIFTKLLELSKIPKSDSFTGLRSMIDKINNCVLTLKRLNVDMQFYSGLLYPLILRVLPDSLSLRFLSSVEDPASSLSYFELEENGSADLPKLFNSRFEQLRQFLARDIATKERQSSICLTKASSSRSDPQQGRHQHQPHLPPYQSSRRTPAKPNINAYAAHPAKPHTSSNFGKSRTSHQRSSKFLPKQVSCIFCSGSHFSNTCSTSMSLDVRRKTLVDKNACFRCLRFGHSESTCTRMISCTCCGETHYKIMCDAPRQSASLIALRQCHLLPTGHLTLIGHDRNITARFLLDSGSSCSFISERVFQLLKLKPVGHESLAIHVFGESEPCAPQRLAKVDLRVVTVDNSVLDFRVLVIPEITSNVLPTLPESLRRQLPHPLCDLLNGPKEIGVLFGAGDMMNLIHGASSKTVEDLTLLTTLFGHVAVGSISANLVSRTSLTSSCTPSKVDLTDFWNLEHLGILPSELSDAKPSADKVIDDFRSSVVRKPSGRYSVPLNLNDKVDSLTNNRSICLKQFQTLLKRLNSNPQLKQQYFDEINLFIDKGFAELLPPNEEPRYFLPHFPVVNQDKQSYKVRPVFNASSHSRGSLSLNDCLLDTPNLLPTSVGILVNFRRYRVALIADISKAYLMVEVHPQFRNLLCFFWLRPNSSSDTCVYRMTSNTFGVKDSQFNAIMIIRDHARLYEKKYPAAVKALLTDLYMDDLLTGGDCVEEVQLLKNQIVEIVSSAQMELKKWGSNAPEVIPCQTVDAPLTVPTNGTKVLGITWSSKDDLFSFRSQPMLEFCKNSPATKRTMLGAVARLHDPLGFLSPFVMELKILLQESHRQRLNFDTVLPPDLMKHWRNWQSQLSFLDDFRVRRCYAALTPVRHELHCFVDASDKAYAAVIYLKSIDVNGHFEISFVASKARVAPLKSAENFSIPRKELLAALCGIRLMRLIYSYLDLASCSKFYWSDSQVVLHWIYSGTPKKWAIFVSNRLEEILANSAPTEWSHCPGELNPADLPSRGCRLQKLISSNSWFYGPDFLGDDSYPRFNPSLESNRSGLELRQIHSLTTSTVEVFDVSKYSTLTKAVRVFATLLRVVRVFKTSLDGSPRPSGPLRGSELADAKHRLLLEAQKRCFGADYSRIINHEKPTQQRFSQFAPFVATDDLIRVGGRLTYLEESEDVKHPILLTDDPFTRLLILDVHCRGLCHLRVDIVQCKLRERFWILRCRQLVKSVLSRCFICRKYSARLSEVEEAPLPPNRVEVSLRPFKTAGVDYLGHFFIRLDDVVRKAWIVIFCCSVTRALYLDIVLDMTSYSFLSVLKRFVSTYGVPDTLVSDNARYFSKSSVCLRNLWSHLTHTDVQDFFGQHGIRWEFNAPRASWWGGQFERMVRVVKDCLRKTMKQQKFQILEFLTLIKEIEAAINSRPLTVLPSESDQPVALTPGHFLASKVPLFLPAGQIHSASDKPEVLVRLWKSRERVLSGFWNRWKREYLLFLRSAHQRRTKSTSVICKDDVVLIKDESLHRGFWKLGRVDEVFIGRDGVHRTFRVKVGVNKFVVRAAQCLCKLEF